MDRNTRNLIHQKANKPKLSRRIPKSNEGADGDEQVSVTRDGVVLHKKVNGKWYSFFGTENVTESERESGGGVSSEEYIILNNTIKIMNEGDDLVFYRKDSSGDYTIELQRIN